MQIIYIQPAELKPYRENPRKNDRAVDAVAASIREFGFKVPLVIDKDYEIIAGHTRLKAAIKLGLTEVPCIIADDLTDDQIKAFAWLQIFQIVKENCTTDFRGPNPQDDAMERLLRSRRK